MIEPLLRSLTVFSCFTDYKSEDFKALANCVKVVKVKKNTRIFNYGETSDELYVVLRGQIGIIYPDGILKERIDNGQLNKDNTIELLTNEQRERRMKKETFITARN